MPFYCQGVSVFCGFAGIANLFVGGALSVIYGPEIGIASLTVGLGRVDSFEDYLDYRIEATGDVCTYQIIIANSLRSNSPWQKLFK